MFVHSANAIMNGRATTDSTHTHTHTYITSQCGWLIAVLTRIRAFCFAVFHFGPLGVGERDVPRPRAFSSTLGTHLPAECRSDQNPFHSHSEFHSLRVELKMSAPQNWSTQLEKRGSQAKSQAKSGDARLWHGYGAAAGNPNAALRNSPRT